MNKKKPISATIDESLIEWIEQMLKSNTAYRNKSHIIESALLEYKENKDKNSKKR